jgi:uncharacterized protein with von Willebrand factor type A (vWA) domain
MSRLSSRRLRLDLDSFHRNRYDRIRSQFSLLHEVEFDLESRLGEAGGYLARDLWSSFFDSSVETTSDRSDFAPPLRRFADLVFDSLSKSEEFTNLRDLCRGSTFAAIEATDSASTFVKSLALPELRSEDERDTTTATGENGDSLSVSKSRDGKTVEVKQSRSGVERQSSKEFDSVEEANDFAQKVLLQAEGRGFSNFVDGYRDTGFESRLSEVLDNLENSPTDRALFDAALRAELRETFEQVEEKVALLATTFGDEEAERIFSEPTKEDLELFFALSNDRTFRDFVQQVGRFVESIRSSSLPEKVRGSLAVDGIESSKKFSNLLPSERVLLATPALRAYQTSRILSGKALGYRRSEVGSRSSGDFLVALDTSHSMTVANRKWPAPAAFAAAAAIVASEEGRKVSVVTFSTSVEEVEFDSESSTGRAEFLRRMLAVKPSGGTDFRPVVERADSLAPFSDLLFVSDGDGPLDEERTREVFATRSLAYLVIGGPSSTNATLADIATPDRTIVADSLSSEAVDLVASFTR